MACATGLAFLLLTSAAPAQTTPTVQSLLDEGYAVVESFFNPQAGAVLFLQRHNKLFMCVVRETPETTPLTTLYCKPVE